MYRTLLKGVWLAEIELNKINENKLRTHTLQARCGTFTLLLFRGNATLLTRREQRVARFLAMKYYQDYQIGTSAHHHTG